MNSRSWQILCWNIRGLNDSNKWEAVRNKVEESACSIFCLQETKMTDCDSAFVRNLAPRRFDKFDFVSSIGASGGILLVWNNSIFSGTILDKQRFGITSCFVSNQNSNTWKLTVVYGPCTEPMRSEFISWFRGHDIKQEDNWLFLGDFNFYRSLENQNKPGGNVHDTFLFNDAISHLCLVELPLKGWAFTWNNMQQNPLLEQLDWFFTSVNWIMTFPWQKLSL
jgi:exonuclease III